MGLSERQLASLGSRKDWGKTGPERSSLGNASGLTTPGFSRENSTAHRSGHLGDGVPSWKAGASWKLGGSCYLKGSEDIGAWIEDGLASQTVAPSRRAVLRARCTQAVEVSIQASFP